MKVVLRRKLIVLSVYIQKLESFHTSNIKVYLKAPKKEIKTTTLIITIIITIEEEHEANKPNRNRQQETIKTESQINQLEKKKTVQRANETKCCFFVKINKVDKPLAKFTKIQTELIRETQEQTMKMTMNY